MSEGLLALSGHLLKMLLLSLIALPFSSTSPPNSYSRSKIMIKQSHAFMRWDHVLEKENFLHVNHLMQIKMALFGQIQKLSISKRENCGGIKMV